MKLVGGKFKTEAAQSGDLEKATGQNPNARAQFAEEEKAVRKGVAAIGNHSKWKNVRVDDLATRVAMGPFGSDIKADNFVPFGVPVIRGNNLTSGRFNAADFAYLTEMKADELKNSNAFPGDLVFTHRGTLGQVGIIAPSPFPRYVVSQSQMLLSCARAVVDPLFLFYFFKSPGGQHQLLANTSQTGVPAISRPVTSLKAVCVPLPPLPEQRAIASVLGALDDKIELNRRMNQTLEAMAQALFQNWFLDAAQAGLPKGWRMAAIAEIAILNIWTLGKNDDLDRLEYIEISEVSRGDINNVQVYRRGQEPSRARRRLRHGDTVVSTVRPDRGSYFLCLSPSPNLIASTGFAVVTPTKAPWSFIHAALTQPEFFEHLG